MVDQNPSNDTGERNFWPGNAEISKTLFAAVGKMKQVADTPVPLGYAVCAVGLALLASKKPIALLVVKRS